MSWHVPVSLGAVLLVVTVGDGTDDNATNSPEHLQHLSGRSSESEGYNLTAVGGCVGDEDSPWDTLKDLRGEHDGKRVGEVEDEDEGVQEHETGQSSVAVTDAAGKRTSDEDTNESTELSRNLERRLPLCCDDPDCLTVDNSVDAKFLDESGKSDEVAHEEDIVGFHDLRESVCRTSIVLTRKTYNCAGHDKGPERSHGVSLHGLNDRHVVFDILGLDGFSSEVAYSCLFGEDSAGLVLELLGMAGLVIVVNHLVGCLTRQAIDDLGLW